MSVPLDQSSIPRPVPGDTPAIVPEPRRKSDGAQVEYDENALKGHDTKGDTVGRAVIEQREVIPTTGKRMPTGKWEYIAFCVFYFSIPQYMSNKKQTQNLHHEKKR